MRANNENTYEDNIMNNYENNYETKMMNAMDIITVKVVKFIKQNHYNFLIKISYLKHFYNHQNSHRVLCISY